MDWRVCAFIDTEGYPWLPPLCGSSLPASRLGGGTGCFAEIPSSFVLDAHIHVTPPHRTAPHPGIAVKLSKKGFWALQSPCSEQNVFCTPVLQRESYKDLILCVMMSTWEPPASSVGCFCSSLEKAQPEYCMCT